MIKSMTGFGHSQVTNEGYKISLEIKSVNHRFLDPHIRISRRYTLLEDRIREELKNFVNRGRLDVNINIEKIDDSLRDIKLDKDLAIAYYYYLKDLAEKLNISQEIRVIDVFRLPEVFSLEEKEENWENLWEVLKEAITIAMKELLTMRINEGQNLARDIMQRNQLILSRVEKLECRSPEIAEENMERLRKRISELVSQQMLDEARIVQEAAIFADKSSITEEIVRLKSHSDYLSNFLNSDDPIGRKADFLVQEMFREINTIASKANDLEMSQIVVEVKAELEKIREQLQNIE
ncbi:MAG: YicC family protein [Syntrophomonas sp.]|nr:YicC family protein [Syntrophomonas sp.]MDD3879156.1 YicC family protein [Syntrophomonas sp.]